MKKLFIICLLLLFAAASVQAQALKRVPKKNKKDSSKAETVVKKTDPVPVSKAPKEKDRSIVPPKDQFIDKDGDGINDNVARSKPPAVKKQKPMPKPPKIKSKPVRQKPESRPKAKTKSKPAQGRDKDKDKKSRR